MYLRMSVLIPSLLQGPNTAVLFFLLPNCFYWQVLHSHLLNKRLVSRWVLGAAARCLFPAGYFLLSLDTEDQGAFSACFCYLSKPCGCNSCFCSARWLWSGHDITDCCTDAKDWIAHRQPVVCPGVGGDFEELGGEGVNPRGCVLTCILLPFFSPQLVPSFWGA